MCSTRRCVNDLACQRYPHAVSVETRGFRVLHIVLTAVFETVPFEG